MPQQTIEATLENVPAVQAAVISAHVPVDEMFAHVPTTITAVVGWLTRKGIPCKGNPLILHLGIEDDSLEVEVGWPVDGAVEGDDTVSIRSYPPTRAAVLEHRGRYEELPALYGPLEQWIRAQGLTPTTPVREPYVTNPSDTTDPESWVTRIVWPVS